MTEQNEWSAHDFKMRGKARIKHMDETAGEITAELSLPREVKYDLLSAMAVETPSATFMNYDRVESPLNPFVLPRVNNRDKKPLWRLRSFATGLSAVLVIGLLIGGYALLFASRHSETGTTSGGVHRVHQSTVIVGTYDGKISALKSSDGSLLWQYQAGHPFEGSAIVVLDDTIYAVSLDGHVYALQRDTGKLLWQQAVTISSSIPNYTVNVDNLRIAATSDIVAVSYTDLPIAAPVGVMDVFRARGGTLLWHEPIFYQESTLLGVDNNAVYVTDTPSDNGDPLITRALRAGDGKELWRNSSNAIGLPAPYTAPSLVAIDGVLYGYSLDGTALLALNAQSGHLLWKQKAAQDGNLGKIVAGNGEIYLATQTRFCAYRMSNGDQLWCIHARQSSDPSESGYFEQFEQTIFMQDIAYVGRGGFNPAGFRIEAWDAGKGTLRWSWPSSSSLLHGDFSWRFTGANGVLYVPTQQGLYAIRGSDGHQLWFAKINLGFGPLVAGT